MRWKIETKGEKCDIIGEMERKRIKKYIYWGIFILFVVGSILAGSPFQLIDLIVVRPIVNILFVIFNVVHDFGLAIIILTLIVKTCMLPLAIRQMNQMKLIRKIQPMLTEIKKNCKGNKQLESLQTMDLYRRYNVKPFSSILTLVIQLPIFIALFSAITVIASPKPQDNLMNRAYGWVAYQGSEIQELEEKQQTYLADLEKMHEEGQGQTEGQEQGDTQENEEETKNEDNAAETKEAVYDFHPQLFGVINLNVKAGDLISGKFSWSAAFILACAILASLMQYFVTRQQMPSGKSEKSKKFRDMVREAKEGRELDETDISNLTTKQMSYMMPAMMFFLMFNFTGAIVFYYFLTNVYTAVQQWIILRKVNEEIDAATDKAVLKELSKVQEGEVIENKKTGTKIRTLSAKDVKDEKKMKSSKKSGSKKGGKGSKKKGV